MNTLADRIRQQEELLKVWWQNLEKGDATIYEGNVTGLSHHQYERYKAYIKVGSELVVRLDENNIYDRNASGIWVNANNRILEQVGWIPKQFNAVVAEARRREIPLVAIVTKHRPDATDFQRKLYIKIGPDTSFNFVLTPTQEQTQMANSKVSNIVQKNVDLGTSAAFLEAGRIANNQLSSLAGKKLPIMVRAYADTALGRLILANVALLAQEHFRPDDTRLQKLANAMTVSAYQEVLQQFDVESFIDDLLSNNTIKKALKQVDTAEA